jgi:hypothetical protein
LSSPRRRRAADSTYDDDGGGGGGGAGGAYGAPPLPPQQHDYTYPSNADDAALYPPTHFNGTQGATPAFQQPHQTPAAAAAAAAPELASSIAATSADVRDIDARLDALQKFLSQAKS